MEKKLIKSKLFFKFLTFGLTSAFIVGTPIITTSCSNVGIENLQDVKFNSKANVIVDFDDFIKVYEEKNDLSSAFNSVINSNLNKSILIDNYKNLSEKAKQNISFNVDISNESSTGWGTKKYSEWKSGTTEAIVNLDSEKITITSLKDLHNKLNDSEYLKKLLTLAGVITNQKTEEQTTTYSLVSESNIGIEKNNSSTSTVNVLHINVEEKTQEKTDKKYDLLIPISNIAFELGNKNVKVSLNNNSVNNDFNLTICFGINQTVITSNKNEFLYTPSNVTNGGKESLSIGELFDSFKWYNDETEKDAKGTEKTLNSKKIGDDLGIYNVEFSNPKDETKIKIGEEGYSGMSISFDATPINGFVWNDGTTSKKTVLIENMNIKIKDAGISNLSYSDTDPYVLVWNNLFTSNNKTSEVYPMSVEDLRTKLSDNAFFEKFQNAIFTYSEYKNDFQSVDLFFPNNETNDITDWTTKVNIQVESS